ncbi:MAG TPA: helix-turn-helix transcriptional regulator [Actinopolymorphaceae bacterium]|jgi:DNA-binding PadR family transcriptional regulator
MRGDQIRGHLDALVLACLDGSPAHGYDVITRLRERSNGELDLAEGTVYPALHRLEADGALTAAWHQVQGRRRKVYSLTAEGHRMLASHRRDWHAFTTLITRVLGAPA